MGAKGVKGMHTYIFTLRALSARGRIVGTRRAGQVRASWEVSKGLHVQEGDAGSVIGG